LLTVFTTRKVQFVKSDVTSWPSLVTLFKAAVANSPDKSVDIVIANAGVSGVDDVFKLDDPHSDPIEPNLRIININMIGVLYTAKLAMHYFRLHLVSDERDRLLIIQGSLAGYLDQPGSPQYAASKYGCRGLMKSLRRTVGKEGMRVNFIGPWFVKTPIMSEAVMEGLLKKGVKFAELGDAKTAALRLAGDKSVNGMSLPSRSGIL
jgi:NAD(P)-dependent dehydrogenase (short-subunit alcohol dehydrogenase family)